MQALITPPQSEPVLDQNLFGRTWYLFLQTMQEFAATGAGIVRYGTHRARLSEPALQLVKGTVWIETDTGLVYQWRPLNWAWIAGTIAAAYASLPGTLGTNDAGFLFLATDTYRLYRWSGLAWVELTPANDCQMAYCSLTLTLTNVAQDIPGATLTLNRAGRYLIHGVYDITEVGAGDVSQILIGSMVADGSVQGQAAILNTGAANDRATVSQQWLYTAAAAGKIVKLQGRKNAGTGASTINATHTSISALWIGP